MGLQDPTPDAVYQKQSLLQSHPLIQLSSLIQEMLIKFLMVRYLEYLSKQNTTKDKHESRGYALQIHSSQIRQKISLKEKLFPACVGPSISCPGIRTFDLIRNWVKWAYDHYFQWQSGQERKLKMCGKGFPFIPSGHQRRPSSLQAIGSLEQPKN